MPMIPFIGVLKTMLNTISSKCFFKINAPNFGTHIRQELRFTPVRQLGRFSRSSVLLDTLAQVVHHLIDLGHQRVSFSAGLDSDESCEIAIHSSCRDLPRTWVVKLPAIVLTAML